MLVTVVVADTGIKTTVVTTGTVLVDLVVLVYLVTLWVVVLVNVEVALTVFEGELTVTVVTIDDARAVASWFAIGVPHPVTGSHPVEALYPLLDPEVMSWKYDEY